MQTVATLFYLIIVIGQLLRVLPYSISRLLFDFPRRKHLSDFLNSVSSIVRDPPKHLIDLSIFNGFDGNHLQIPMRGGGGPTQGFLTKGGDEGWRKGLLALPFLKKNDTASAVSYVSTIEESYNSRKRKAAATEVDSFIKRWWARNTAGSKGLLIYLFPALCAQLSILRTAVPFFLDRLSQYLQPIYIGLSFLLLQKRGNSMIQAVLWTSVLVGGYFMLSDTYNAGSSWVPLKAKEDSYAVITGASSGIGLELARLLYLDGFSLILISRQSEALMQLKTLLEGEELAAERTDSQVSTFPSSSSSSSPQDGRQDQPNVTDEGRAGGNEHCVDEMQKNKDRERASRCDIFKGCHVDESQHTARSLKRNGKNGSKRRAVVRSVATSTSYKAVSAYDGDFLYEEHDHDAVDGVERSVVRGEGEGESHHTAKGGAGHGQEIVTIPCDLTDAGSVMEVMRELKRMRIDDKVDVLVNNAGSAVRGPLMQSPVEDLSQTLDLNVKATVLLTRLLAPRIAKRGSGGRILFMGSLSSVGPGPTVAVYAATKAFLQSFAMSLRRELISEGVFVTLALPGAIRDTPFASKAGAEDALVFRGPGLSLSVEHTASDIYKGLKQGRDVVVPGLVNKLYTYLFSQILPSAAVGAITQAAWSPAPKWMPFLRPLASDLLLQEEIRRQKRRLREKQDADRALAKRIEKSQRKHGRFNSFFNKRTTNEGDESQNEGGKYSSNGKDEYWTTDAGSADAGAYDINLSNQGAPLAHRNKKRNRMQELGALCQQAISKKKSMVANAFQNFTRKLNLPSRDEIRDGCDVPVAHSLDSFKRDRGTDGESELEKKLREAVEREKRERKVEGKEEAQATSSKGPFRLFKNAQSQFSNWALNFWYRPVIDYSAIREWAAVPFRPKGQDIVLDEEVEAEAGSDVLNGQKVAEDNRPTDTKVEEGKEVQQKVWCEDEITSLSRDVFDISSHSVLHSPFPADDGSSMCDLSPGDEGNHAVSKGISSIYWDAESDQVEGEGEGADPGDSNEVVKAVFESVDDVQTGTASQLGALESSSSRVLGSMRQPSDPCEALWGLDTDTASSSASVSAPDAHRKGSSSLCSSDVSPEIHSMSHRTLAGNACCKAQIAPFMATINFENPFLGPVHPSFMISLMNERVADILTQSNNIVTGKDDDEQNEGQSADWMRMSFIAEEPASARLLPSLLVATDDISFLESLDSLQEPCTLPSAFQLRKSSAGAGGGGGGTVHGELEQYCQERDLDEKEEERLSESRRKECYIV